MKRLIAETLFYASVVTVLVGIGLIRSMWKMRKSFEIAARSPMLLCLSGPAHVALVLLQTLAEAFGSAFPCTITIWASYVCFGVISTAYLLRTARLVVVYDRELRNKYIRLVRPQIQRRCMLGVLACCCLAALIAQLTLASPRNLSGSCFFYEDGFCVFLPLTGLYLAGMVMMASRLRHTNDAFRIKNEMCFICASTAITTVLRTVHIAFLKKLPSDGDWIVPPTIYDLVACTAALYISFFLPLSVFYGVSRRGVRGIRSAHRVFSEENDHSGKSAEDEHAARSAAWEVLQMLKGETMSTLLVNFCEENLCGESVLFLVDVLSYEDLTDASEQFQALTEIVETYLAQGSTNEINVSNAYRNVAQSWLKKKEAFMALDKLERGGVLNKQRDEIAKMLSENLLIKFKQTPLALQAMRALSEMAGGGEEAEERNDHDADMHMMLQASAAVALVTINRDAAREGRNSMVNGVKLGVESSRRQSCSLSEGSYYSYEQTMDIE